MLCLVTCWSLGAIADVQRVGHRGAPRRGWCARLHYISGAAATQPPEDVGALNHQAGLYAEAVPIALRALALAEPPN